MTTATLIPETLTLTDRAVLVNLSISQWSAAKTDKKVNREVAQNHGSDENMGNYRKYLIAREAIKKVSEITGAVRQEHYRLSLPWRDSGDRILSTAAYFEYARVMRQKQTEWETAVSEFCAAYPQYIEQARERLNGLFDAAEYPNPDEIKRKFSFRFEVLPVSSPDDFRVNLGASEIARIQNQIREDSQAQLQRAMRDVWDRMRDVIEGMRDKLRAYSVRKDGSIDHPFRDSVVTNITDLLEIIPLLNLTDDPHVTQFAAAMSDDLTRYSPEQLRDAEYARNDTAARAEEILSKMSAFIS